MAHIDGAGLESILLSTLTLSAIMIAYFAGMMIIQALRQKQSHRKQNRR